MDEVIFQGKIIIPGEARGPALISREPLSFWGGYDWKTGEIIDRPDLLAGIEDITARRLSLGGGYVVWGRRA